MLGRTDSKTMDPVPDTWDGDALVRSLGACLPKDRDLNAPIG